MRYLAGLYETGVQLGVVWTEYSKVSRNRFSFFWVKTGRSMWESSVSTSWRTAKTTLSYNYERFMKCGNRAGHTTSATARTGHPVAPRILSGNAAK